MTYSVEQILKQIEGRVDSAQSLMLECIELIYKASYNEGIEDSAQQIDLGCRIGDYLRKLKK